MKVQSDYDARYDRGRSTFCSDKWFLLRMTELLSPKPSETGPFFHDSRC